MSINPINQNMLQNALMPLSNNEAFRANDTSVGATTNQQTLSVQSNQSISASALLKNDFKTQNKPVPEGLSSSQNKPDRAMSHVVETYNQQGELLLKFMDSNSNLLYQVPSEMESKMKEMMSKQETSTNTTG